jgi:hypothetical protein
MQRSKKPLFDHLVGERDQLRWNFEMHRLGGLQVNDKLKFRGLQDRKVGNLLALENATSVDSSLAVSVGEKVNSEISHSAPT